MKPSSLKQAVGLLERSGYPMPPEFRDRLDRYLGLIHEWNTFAGLTSAADSGRLLEHVVDSLSLVPYCPQGEGLRLLDIGSGGGFPAIPLRLWMPEMSLTLVERKERKVAFLRKVLGELELKGVTVLLGAFPEVARETAAEVVTARAVERPERVLRGAKGWIERGAVLLSQHPDTPRLLEAVFHVERVEDEWSALGLRRGALYRVHRL